MEQKERISNSFDASDIGKNEMPQLNETAIGLGLPMAVLSF